MCFLERSFLLRDIMLTKKHVLNFLIPKSAETYCFVHILSFYHTISLYFSVKTFKVLVSVHLQNREHAPILTLLKTILIYIF